MPRKPLKPCRHPGCPNLSENSYCQKHLAMNASDYNKFKRDEQSQSFYESPAWRKLSKWQLKKQPLCKHCLKQNKFVKAQLVDHIIPIKQGGDKLNPDNLQSLCWGCHNKKTKNE